MFCSKCGKEMNDDAAFCPACGQPSNATPGQAPAGQQSAPGAQHPAQPQMQPAQQYQGQYQAQPYAQQRPMGPKIPNHLVWAIFSILLFWPTGIPAVVYATRVDSKLQYGDIAGAQEASSKAKTFSIISTVVCAVWILLAIIISAVAAAAGY